MCGIFAGSAECAQAMIIVLTIYATLFISAIIGGAVFWIHKKRGWAIWWASVMINIFAFMQLLGAYGNLAYAMQVFAMIVWPIVNIAWLINLICSELKGKHGKKKKFLSIF